MFGDDDFHNHNVCFYSFVFITYVEDDVNKRLPILSIQSIPKCFETLRQKPNLVELALYITQPVDISYRFTTGKPD